MAQNLQLLSTLKLKNNNISLLYHSNNLSRSRNELSASAVCCCWHHHNRRSCAFDWKKKKILMALLQFLTLIKAIQWTLGPLGWLVLATVSMSSVMFALNESVSNSCKIFSTNILWLLSFGLVRGACWIVLHSGHEVKILPAGISRLTFQQPFWWRLTENSLNTSRTSLIPL